jgi:DNA repair protein SbcC/Rad50
MISRLTYEVIFSRTGRKLQADLTFPQGLTAIVGRNESGKSFMIEMLRYALFGSEALRGKSDDYAKLEVALSVTIRSELYHITRTLKKAEVRHNDTALAVGTGPVNQKLLQILGFGLAIFDVVCSANQGDVEALSNMKPAERKRMVDNIVGADKLVSLATWCSEKGLEYKREVSVLERNLTAPLELALEPPIVDNLDVAETVTAERNRLEGERNALVASRIMEPPERPSGPSLSDLNQRLAAVHDVNAQRRAILSRPTLTFDPVVETAKWYAKDRSTFIARHPKATRSRTTIEADIKYAQQQDAVRKSLQRLKTLKDGPKILCECGKPFYLDQEELHIAEQQHAALPRVDLGRQINVAALHIELRQIEDWEDPDTLAGAEQFKALPSVEGEPSVSKEQLRNVEGAISFAERDLLLSQLNPTDDENVIAAGINAWQTYERDQAVYAAWVETARSDAQRRDKIEQQLNKMVVYDLQALRVAHSARLRWESERDQYERDLSRYNALLEQVTEAKQQIEGWDNAKKAVQTLALEIKQHLVPALSAVASHLLAQMTGGSRQSIVVDEHFEIMVDGQLLNTLSGSGKACANLALRLGLAKVLTNNVLSLFIGDEIDGSMDSDRSEHLQRLLYNSIDQVSQILLVTHKMVAVKSVIEMGNVHTNTTSS